MPTALVVERSVADERLDIDVAHSVEEQSEVLRSERVERTFRQHVVHAALHLLETDNKTCVHRL